MWNSRSLETILTVSCRHYFRCLRMFRSLLALKLVYKFEESAQLFRTFKVFIIKLNQMKHAFFWEFLGDFSHNKWTISVLSRNLSCKDVNARFTTVPFKPFLITNLEDSPCLHNLKSVYFLYFKGTVVNRALPFLHKR